jgi:hypothetical protein
MIIIDGGSKMLGRPKRYSSDKPNNNDLSTMIQNGPSFGALTADPDVWICNVQLLVLSPARLTDLLPEGEEMIPDAFH